MSLLQRLKAAQQGGEPGPAASNGALAVKTLAVPSPGPGRRPSGGANSPSSSPGPPGPPRHASQSTSTGRASQSTSTGRASQSSGGGGGGGGRPSQSSGRPSVAAFGFGGMGGGGARGGGPSLIGLLASKRLAKRFASRFHNRNAGARSVPVQKEPTYRLEPHCKFNPEKVEAMLKSMLEERLGKLRYSPKICPNMCKILGDEIKQRVKHMSFDRYKLVSNVMIGQKKSQGLSDCSRCAWDERVDSFATHTFQNEHIFCTATVFAVYNE